MKDTPPSHIKVSRRTLAAGAAWSVPAVAVSTLAPAYAASCKDPKVQEKIDNFFDTYADSLPDLSSQKLRFWFQNSDHANGALNESGMRVQNVAGEAIDFGRYPLMVEIGIKSVETSHAVNETFKWVCGPAECKKITLPWVAQGNWDATRNDADPARVNQCKANRRDISVGTSYFTIYDPANGDYVGTNPTELGEEKMSCLANNTAYGFTGAFHEHLPARKELRVMAYHWRDATTSGASADYSTPGFRVLGFAPPRYSDLKARYQKGLSDSDFDLCYKGPFNKKAASWTSDISSKAPTILSRGWAKSWIDNAVVKNPDTFRGADRKIPLGTWVWANESGTFVDEGNLKDGGIGVSIGPSIGSKGRDGFNHPDAPGYLYSSSVNQAGLVLRFRDGIY